MMDNDFSREARRAVAIKPGSPGGSTFRRADYEPEMWERMVRATQLDPKANSNARLVFEGTFEGEVMLAGIPSVDEICAMDAKEIKKLYMKYKLTQDGEGPELMAAKLFDKMVSEAGIKRDGSGETAGTDDPADADKQ